MARQLDNPVWDAGYNAYFDGKDRDENPHPEDSQDEQDWDDGWDTASGDDDR